MSGSLTNAPFRPTWNDEMKKELAIVVGTKIHDEWDANDDTLESCIEISEKVLNWGSNGNGFELAKDFEDEGFHPDKELVELLDNISYDKYRITENFVKAWVVANSLQLHLKEGQKVLAKIVRLGEKECTIVKLYPETMKYGLRYEGYVGEGHLIVNAEAIVSVL
jgi:hypothetical protein